MIEHESSTTTRRAPALEELILARPGLARDVACHDAAIVLEGGRLTLVLGSGPAEQVNLAASALLVAAQDCCDGGRAPR